MAKRVDPLKAKAAKQKKIAIVLSVLFVLVLAYQGPKTLKMLKGPQPVAAEAAAAPAATPEAAPSAGAPAVTTAAGTPATADSQPAVLADTDLPVVSGAGQLLSFEQFASKDPFQQQAEAVVTAGSTAATADGKAAAAPATGATPATDPTAADPVSPGVDPSIPGSAENPPLSVGGVGSSGSSGTDTPASPTVPATSGAGAATGTTISVNGIVSTITVGTPFPTDNPTFELVSIAKDGKSVQIGVAGGSLAGGKATVKLTLGKPLTLQNTADGSRYQLKLLTVAASNG